MSDRGTRFSPPPPPDQPARDAIIHDVDQTLFVEAAAGTGKTTSMVERMLTLIRRGQRVATITAITFTRKAAAELRGRFYQRLQQAASQLGDSDEAQRLRRAIDELDRCTISTIHSFCSRLLRQRPFEAGVGMNFIELDEESETVLREEAWDAFVEQCLTEGRYMQELEANALTFSELRQTFATFNTYSDVTDWPVSVDVVDEAMVASVRQQSLVYAQEMRSLWPKLQDCDPGNDVLIPLYLEFPRVVSQLASAPPGRLLDYLCGLAPTRKIVQRQWGEDKASKDEAKAQAQRWETFWASVIGPILPKFRSQRYAVVMAILQDASGVYADWRRQRGAMDFQDLLTKTAVMLREHELVRRHFQEQIRYLLVDEFQDTDPIQAEIMMLLTSDDLRESDWTRCRPIPGALFVVGDPKQSIYRFRRADIGTYQAVRSQIIAAGGRAVSLTTNFRSSRAVVDWFNEIYGQAAEGFFAAGPTVHQAAACMMFAGKDLPGAAAEADINGVYRLDLAGRKVEDVLAEEPPIIAAFIRNAIDGGATILDFERDSAGEQGDMIATPRPVRPGDFMILTYRKNDLTPYADALVAAGVPVQVTGGGQLNMAGEIAWLQRTLAALADPMNTVALAAYLRSELMGFSDDELHTFRRAGGVFDYRCAIPETLRDGSPDVAVMFDEAFGRLRRYAGWIDQQYPPVVVIEKILDDLGVLLHAAGSADAEARVGALGRLVELMRDQQREDFNAAELLALLERIVAKEVTFDVIPPRAYSEPPVRVMNLHKAKGLEAPIVILAGPIHAPKIDPKIHIEREGTRSQGHMCCVKRAGKKSTLVAAPVDWEAHAEAEAKFQVAEKARLLYVAATRAGRALVVSRKGGGGSRSSWAPLDPFLDYPLVFPLDSITFGPVAPATPAEVTPETREVYDVAARVAALVAPTHAMRSAKTFALSDGVSVASAESGLGQAWGSAVHHVLEHLSAGSSESFRNAAADAVTAYDLEAAIGEPREMLIDELVMVAGGVAGSALWARAQAATQWLVETPYVRRVEGEVLETLERGVIDLAFEEPDGWVLVDYKTDAAAKDNPADLLERYRPQLATYAEAWTQMTDLPVKETGLYFVATGEYHAYC